MAARTASTERSTTPVAHLAAWVAGRFQRCRSVSGSPFKSTANKDDCRKRSSMASRWRHARMANSAVDSDVYHATSVEISPIERSA